MTVKYILPSDDLTGASWRRPPNPRQRILVVEDDPLIRRLNTEVLVYSGYHVDTAEDGAVAWDALQVHNYNLVVTDNDMPKVTGVDLVKKARAAGLALPIVMATAKAPAWGFIQQSAVEPVLVLLKPYTFDEFLTAVKKVLRTSAQTSNEPTPPPNWQNHFPAARMRG